MNRRLLNISLFVFLLTATAFGQTYIADMKRQSARSDERTGGSITKATLVAGDPDIKITINVPAFQMTLWQNGQEIRSYPIGVGMLEFPIAIGPRRGTSIEWNPVWIPPSSDWIDASSSVKPGEIVLPTDPRNPLGKVKIPLGYGYLLHQAKGPGDMGSLVSHGCIRVMQSDLYDLAEKIVAARSLAVSPRQIASAKRTKRTLIAVLEPAVDVEITYDTMVVEAGTLHIYPDVYRYKTNTAANLRAEFRSNGIDDSGLSNAEIKKMIAAAAGRNQFVVRNADISAGGSIRNGKVVPVVGRTARPGVKPIIRRKRRP
ncbi:MAG TPA: L,D-transpeptidase [Pyrinomonadaceae bacterium]|nr:L,D-transpeptidase [Pyrinomonadaceae bacterium]